MFKRLSLCVAVLGVLFYALSPHIFTSPTSLGEGNVAASTIHCTEPHPGAPRLVQYALMIDVSGIGSGMHIYKFHNCGASPTLEDDTMKWAPGHSATRRNWESNADVAAKSLDVLLDEALRIVPSDLHRTTPVLVKPSRGLLITASSQLVLSAIHRRLSARYPFPIHGDWADDAADQGIYTWLAVNYLSGAMGGDSPSSGTYAILDMELDNTQIMFEPTFSNDHRMPDGDHKRVLNFAGTDHTLYHYFHEGFGLVHLGVKVHQRVCEMSLAEDDAAHRCVRGGDDVDDGEVIPNPCLSRGTQRKEMPMVDRWMNMSGSDIGSFGSCSRIVEDVMEKDAPCAVGPCSFSGAYQPSVQETFPRGKVFLLSWFYKRLAPLHEGMSELTIDAIADDARAVCAGEEAWKERWGTEVVEELRETPDRCLDLAYMHVLLKFGYGFAADREVTIAEKINGTELGWSWGAVLAMVGGE